MACDLVGEVLNIGGGQPEGLDLAELPVHRLRGDELPQVAERCVHAAMGR